MALKIQNEFGITDPVYLKTDPVQALRIVTALIITQGTIKYRLVYDDTESEHFGFEITTTPYTVSPEDTDSE